MTTVSSVGVMLTRYEPVGLPHAFDMLVAAGADHVEINPTLLHMIAHGRPRAEIVRCVTSALAGRSLGVTIHAPLSLNFMDDTHAPLHRAVGVASVEICAALGARRMVVHPGWVEGRRFRLERDRLMAMERDGLRDLAETAARAGVTLCLENMPPTAESPGGTLDNHGLDCRSVAAQIAAVGHPNLAATIDVSHAYIASRYLGLDMKAQLNALAPVTRHLHLHDSFGRVHSLPRPQRGELLAYGMGDLHLPLGWGDLPWQDMLADLPLPEEASMTIEINPLDATQEAITDSVAKARTFAAMIAAETRKAAADERELIGTRGAEKEGHHGG